MLNPLREARHTFLPPPALTASSPYQTSPRWLPVSPLNMLRVPGLCLACREMGNIWSCCPKATGGVALDPRKWYPFHDVHEHVLCGLVRGAGGGKSSSDVRGAKVFNADTVEVARLSKEMC